MPFSCAVDRYRDPGIVGEFNSFRRFILSPGSR